MEKILIGTQELNVIPMGINLNAQNKTTRFDIITELSYIDLENLLLTEENLKVIKHLSGSSEVLATYTDCIALKSITKERGKYITDDSVAHDVFTIVLNTDATVTKVRALEEGNVILKQENVILKQEIVELKELVDTLVVTTLEV